MIEQKPNTDKFLSKIQEVSEVYKQAFAGYPWFEDLSYDVIQGRLNSNIQKRGFQAFLAEAEDKVVGCMWFDTPTLDELQAERGTQLRQYAQQLCEANKISTLVWEREVMVKPEYQRKKIGTQLRMAFIGFIAGQYPEGAIILSRMRDDNFGIITIAEQLGFQRSGIKVPSSQKPDVSHEYWRNIIK